MNYSGVRQFLLHQELLNSSQRQGLIKQKNQGSLLSFTKHVQTKLLKTLKRRHVKESTTRRQFFPCETETLGGKVWVKNFIPPH